MSVTQLTASMSAASLSPAPAAVVADVKVEMSDGCQTEVQMKLNPVVLKDLFAVDYATDQNFLTEVRGIQARHAAAPMITGGPNGLKEGLARALREEARARTAGLDALAAIRKAKYAHIKAVIWRGLYVKVESDARTALNDKKAAYDAKAAEAELKRIKRAEKMEEDAKKLREKKSGFQFTAAAPAAAASSSAAATAMEKS